MNPLALLRKPDPFVVTGGCKAYPALPVRISGLSFMKEIVGTHQKRSDAMKGKAP